MLTLCKTCFLTSRCNSRINYFDMTTTYRVYRISVWHNGMAKQIDCVRAIQLIVTIYITCTRNRVFIRHNGMTEQIDSICAIQFTVIVHISGNFNFRISGLRRNDFFDFVSIKNGLRFCTVLCCKNTDIHI